VPPRANERSKGPLLGSRLISSEGGEEWTMHVLRSGHHVEEIMQNVELHPTTTTVHEEPRRERGHRVAVGGSAVEVLLAIGAVVLSILGLAGAIPVPLASIAVIATGASLLFEGLALGASAEGAHEPRERHAMMGGVGAESVAGLGAIALGILSLIGIDPMILLPISAILLGAGLLLSAAAPVETEEPLRTTKTEARERESMLAATGVHSLVGVGAVVLGILGVLGISPLTMTLVTTLAIGGGLLLSGAAIGARVAGVFRHGT
jgi:hypothetical protein